MPRESRGNAAQQTSVCNTGLRKREKNELEHVGFSKAARSSHQPWNANTRDPTHDNQEH